jgi:hypothetical protein
MVMLKRFPNLLRPPAKVNYPILPVEEQNKYPDFSQDFELLNSELEPYFEALDYEALRTQNEFHREQVIVILGGVVLTLLGTLQAIYSTAIWPGIVEAIIAFVLTVFTLRARELGWQEKYFNTRLKAETLRGEYFLFLGKIGPYADEQTRKHQLIDRIADIREGEKNNG